MHAPDIVILLQTTLIPYNTNNYQNLSISLHACGAGHAQEPCKPIKNYITLH